MKNILIKKVPEDLYFKTLRLKAKLNAQTWIDFLEIIYMRLEDSN